MTDVTKLKLYPLTAWDEVSFSRRMARVLALILPDVGDLAAAEALATNCVTVFCAVRGAIDEVRTPEDLLYRLTLDEIAQLAERYARLRDGWCEPCAGRLTRHCAVRSGPLPPPRRRNPMSRCGSRASGRRPNLLPPCVCPGRSRRRALRQSGGVRRRRE